MLEKIRQVVQEHFGELSTQMYAFHPVTGKMEIIKEDQWERQHTFPDGTVVKCEGIGHWRRVQRESNMREGDAHYDLDGIPTPFRPGF